MTAALAVAARLGILIKSARFLEALGDIDTLMLDKTGTVTIGRLEVVTVRPFGGETSDEVLREAAVCAAGSRHPVSMAIRAATAGVDLGGTESIEEVPGRGVAARETAPSCASDRPPGSGNSASRPLTVHCRIPVPWCGSPGIARCSGWCSSPTAPGRGAARRSRPSGVPAWRASC